MNFKRFITNVILILSLIIILDQITKYLALVVLFKDNQVLMISYFLNFRPVWNDGISFGMFQGYGNLGRVIFIVIALIISIWIITQAMNIFDLNINLAICSENFLK